jgi:transposase-like protein
MRNLLALVPWYAQPMVAALVRTIFAQPDIASARAQLAKVAEGIRPRFPRAAALLEEAEKDVLASVAFPEEHWRQLHSTDPLERLPKEISHRTDVVGIFPPAGTPS